MTQGQTGWLDEVGGSLEASSMGNLAQALQVVEGPAHILIHDQLALLPHHMTFSRVIVNRSPDSEDIFPLEFLIIEQLLLPKGTNVF